MLKRVLSLLLTLITIASASAFAVRAGTAGASIIVSDASAEGGREFKVTVSIKNNPGIMALVLTPDYDKDAFTLTGVENGGMFSGFASAKNLVFDEVESVTNDGVLATLTFTASKGAAAGDHSIGIVVREALGSGSADVSLAAVAGKVSVFAPVPGKASGDVNGDGKVNAKDVTAIMKYLVGAAPKSFDLKAADFDENGKVNAKDVTKLMKALVSSST